MLTMNLRLTIRSDVHMQAHWVAADRTILDVLLVVAGRKIDRHDNLFAARVTDVGGIRNGDGSRFPTTFFHDDFRRMLSACSQDSKRAQPWDSMPFRRPACRGSGEECLF
jgi:hypothetical protein